MLRPSGWPTRTRSSTSTGPASSAPRPHDFVASLVWQPQLDQRRTTARLEGITELDEARTIAESLD